MKRMIELYPEKAEQYQEILNRFKIMDKTKDILEQFKQLLDLDILLPEELSMTYEKRIEQLEGYNSIKEREEAEYDLCIDSFIRFVIENGRRPEFDTDETEERKLTQRYLNCIADLSQEQKDKLKDFIDENNLDCKSWEKVLLGKKVYGKDIEDLIVKKYT